MSSPTLRFEIEGLEILAVAGTQHVGADPARRVAASSGVLDLDDLGTEIGQEHRAVGGSAELL